MEDFVYGSIKLGDRVRIRSGPGLGLDLVGRVVEARGPLGPKGALVFRIRLRRRPRPAYVEVLGEQMEAVPAEG